MTEAQFQRTVIEAAQHLGWLCYHTHDSRRSQEGFPDLVLVRDRVLFVELKTDKGKLTFSQQTWRLKITAALERWLRDHATQGTDYDVDPFAHYVWRPADWPRVEEVLRG